MQKSKRCFLSFGIRELCLGSTLLLATNASAAPLHFAANGNFDPKGNYLPGTVGFNMADVSSVGVLNALPPGVSGMVWIGKCAGVDADFIAGVQPYIGNPRLFGFYLMDSPDPGSTEHPGCSAEMLKAEADWIHTHAVGAKTFIGLRNMSSSRAPSFYSAYRPADSHVDLFGLSAYPCRSEVGGCDYGIIPRYVSAAEQAGFPRGSIVPVYQAFGGGGWLDDSDGKYTMPSASQERQILATWHKLLPTPVFDYAFSWGAQLEDASLESSPELRDVFLIHNAATNSVGVK